MSRNTYFGSWVYSLSCYRNFSHAKLLIGSCLFTKPMNYYISRIVLAGYIIGESVSGSSSGGPSSSPSTAGGGGGGRDETSVVGLRRSGGRGSTRAGWRRRREALKPSQASLSPSVLVWKWKEIVWNMFANKLYPCWWHPTWSNTKIKGCILFSKNTCTVTHSYSACTVTHPDLVLPLGLGLSSQTLL